MTSSRTLIATLVLLLTAGVASAAHVRVRLVADRTAVAPGKTVTVAAVFTIDPGWHVYWTNPGDTGAPPKFKWTLPAGLTVGPPRFPVPHRIKVDEFTAFGYENELTLLMDVTAPADAAGPITLAGKASWVVCREVCILEKQDVAITLDAGEGVENEAKAFAAWRAGQPARSDDAAPLVATVDTVGQRGTIDFPLEAGIEPVEFFPPAAVFAVYEPPAVVDVGGRRVYRTGFKVLPDPPARHSGTAVVVTRSADGRTVAVERPVTFQFVSK